MSGFSLFLVDSSDVVISGVDRKGTDFDRINSRLRDKECFIYEIYPMACNCDVCMDKHRFEPWLARYGSQDQGMGMYLKYVTTIVNSNWNIFIHRITL